MYIGTQSGNLDVGQDFVDRITAYCEKISAMPNIMGRARPELGAGLRSLVFGNYVVFVRYLGGTMHRPDIMQVTHVVHGSRDLDAYFQRLMDDESE